MISLRFLFCLFLETSSGFLLQTVNYLVKPIQFCPLVTLDGNISHYLDDGAYLHSSAVGPVECSLLCTVNQAGRCTGFTHDPLTGRCSIHYGNPYSIESVVQSSPTYPITQLIFPRRLYYGVHISACLLPFTLNGTMYRESCAIAYEYPSGRCNFAMCPTLSQPTIDSQPHAEWAICNPFRARLPSTETVRDIWCRNSTFFVNSTQLLPSKWILIQSRSNGSQFDKFWQDYKTGFGVEFEDYWIGNEALHLLTSMKCSKLFEELPSSTTQSTSEPTSAPSNQSSIAPPSTLPSSSSPPSSSPPSSSPPSSSPPPRQPLPINSFLASSNVSLTSPDPSLWETTSLFTRNVIRYELRMSRIWRLRLEMESREDGKWYSVEYNSVYVGPEEQGFPLQAGAFDSLSSDAGDGFGSCSGLPFAVSTASSGAKEGWWSGCSGSLNAREAFWPALQGSGSGIGGLFHPGRTRMFLQPVSKIFNVSIASWI